MSFSGAKDEFKTIILAVTVTPPWRYWQHGEMENIPPGTGGKHLFIIEDGSQVDVGPVAGQGAADFMETRLFEVIVNYPLAGNHEELVGEVSNDYNALHKALVDRSNWSASDHIVAVLLKKSCKVERKGKQWLARMGFETIING